eukprot:NODE_1301_length_1015_cov_149.346791_g1001_i0.p1 GENE.NODE_1301_length_1015_cov_149.346791_g1001_i0~~NODE_1301_length_1015_cov_149.346791_g1001_i0.p1  ORF type:complete len:246 (-),score=52.45 NODE_1301_length_1015_cov_149.346791_g1001_i0:233-970(-)
MGCGASSADPNVTTARFQSPEQEVEREERREEVMEKYKLTDKDKAKILCYPIFKIPTKNNLDQHVIEMVFFGTKDETCTECTIFFQDKEHQTEIVERQGMNFSLMKEKQSCNRIAFNHSWSGNETWDQPPNDESHTHTEPFENFESEEAPSPNDPALTIPRPVIYINTATHLLGNKSTNAELEAMTTVTDYKMYSGTAKQATEILLKASEAANPEKKEVSALAQLIPVRTSHAPNKNAKDKKPAK